MKYHYVYVLKSKKKQFIYVGLTTNLRRRFKEHSKREELSTKHYAPFDLVFYEAYQNKKDAMRREKYLKTTKGKRNAFHGMGREDIDARCLDWRPFVIEIIEPKKRDFGLKKLEKRINKSKKI